MIEISVVIPVWNAAATLDACLGAVLAQDASRSSYEVIVVDNNSTDGSAALASRHGDVRCLSEPRQGAYAARNSGVRAASGRLLAFTDPDCVPRFDWLSRLVEAMADPRAMVVTGRDRPAGATRALRLLGEYDHIKESCVMEGADAAVYYAHTNNLITRREVFDSVGLFEERARGGDVVFVHRVLELYGTDAVRYEPRARVEHLEIASARVWFRKAFLYGASASSYVRVVRARPLRNTERWRIFRETVRRARLSTWESALLVSLLGLGVACYQLGWWSGRPLGRRAGAADSRELPT